MRNWFVMASFTNIDIFSPRCGNMNYGRRSECNKGCGFKKSDFNEMGMEFGASLGEFSG